MLLCLFLIVISQYVLTLYDLPAFFFVGLGMIVVLADLSVLVRAVLLTIIVCLGAATRETASLILAFAACAYFLQHRLRIHRNLIPIVAATCGFIVVYVSLRLALGGGDAVSMGLMFRENLHFRSLVGILFLISMLFFLYREASSVQRRALIVFQITSAPYLVPVVLVGLWFEIRLWVPLLICMIVVRAYAESLWADGPLELPWIARRASLQAATAESGRG
jgi:hypothetical protein